MGRDYRAEGKRLYGEQCIWCGTGDEVKYHHMDGDHDHDRRDNWVPLCQECHVQLHKGAPPYTIWFQIGQPVVDALDEYREERGLRSRGEAVARLLEAAGTDLSDETWSLLVNHNASMYRDHDA